MAELRRARRTDLAQIWYHNVQPKYNSLSLGAETKPGLFCYHTWSIEGFSAAKLEPSSIQTGSNPPTVTPFQPDDAGLVL